MRALRDTVRTLLEEPNKGSPFELLELADGGTLFLDEVGELSSNSQGRLLLLLDEAARSQKVRIIAGTERDLPNEVAHGRFGGDLLARLSGMCLRIAPLRERTHEIRRMAALFQQNDRAASPRISERAFMCLMEYPWPGNVRELRRTIERASALSGGRTIEQHDLDIAGFRDVTGAGGERLKIQLALTRTAGNQTHAAALLGISRATFVRRLDAYELPRPRLARSRGG